MLLLSLSLLSFSPAGMQAQLFCNLHQIQVSQSLVNSTNCLQTYHVKVANTCPCSAATEVTFFCDGFPQSIVNPNIMKVDGPRCMLVHGEALIQVQPVRFDYTFERQFSFQLESADFTCWSVHVTVPVDCSRKCASKVLRLICSRKNSGRFLSTMLKQTAVSALKYHKQRHLEFFLHAVQCWVGPSKRNLSGTTDCMINSSAQNSIAGRLLKWSM